MTGKLQQFAHSRAWEDDWKYRLSWYVWPQCVAVLLIILLVPGVPPETAKQAVVPWAKPESPAAAPPPSTAASSATDHKTAASAQDLPKPVHVSREHARSQDGEGATPLSALLERPDRFIGTTIKLGPCTLAHAKQDGPLSCTTYEGSQVKASISLQTVNSKTRDWAIANCSGDPTPACSMYVSGAVRQTFGTVFLESVDLVGLEQTPLSDTHISATAIAPVVTVPDLTIPTVSSGTVRFVQDQAPLKALPDARSSTIGLIPNGTTLRIAETVGSWYKVQGANGVGFLHHTWVKADQFQGSTSGEERRIQIKSVPTYADAQEYVRTSAIPVSLYLADNNWFAITLKGAFGKDNAEELLRDIKDERLVPLDSFLTYGNNYVREVQPAPTPANVMAGAAGLKERAEKFVLGMIERGSEDGTKPLAVAAFYQEKVRWYGSLETREHVINEKSHYLERWPGRRYWPRENTVSADCVAASETCIVSGIVDWWVSSSSKGVQKAGSSRFEYEIDLSSFAPVVTGEGGTLLESHNVSAYPANQFDQPTADRMPYLQ